MFDHYFMSPGRGFTLDCGPGRKKVMGVRFSPVLLINEYLTTDGEV